MFFFLRLKFFNKIYYFFVDRVNKFVLKVGLFIFDKIMRVRDFLLENNFINNDGDIYKIFMVICCGML